MGQLAVSVVGATVGWFVGGPTGAQWGWAIGSVVGAAFAPTQKTQGPRLNDLRVMGTEYGQPIAYLRGHPRVAPQVIWASDRRETATTTSQGKGGGPEYTQYTYDIDLLLLLSENVIVGVPRIWSNGELVYNGLSTASSDTIEATAASELWERVTVYTGADDQLPDPDYESAVGTENAPAYRGRGTLFIKGLKLGSSGQLPNLTMEVVVAGTVASQQLVIFQACFRENSTEDESFYENVTTLGTNASVVDGSLECVGPNPEGPDTGLQANVGITAGSAWTVEARVTLANLPSGGDTVNLLIWGSLSEAGIDIEAYKSGSNFNLVILSTSTGGQFIFSVPGAEFHLALVCSGGAFATVKVYIDGSEVHSYVYGASGSHAGGLLQLFAYASAGTTYDVRMDDVRISKYARYTTSFTPPPSPLPPARGVDIVTVEDEDLDDVVSDLCTRAGLAGSQFDVTALAAVTRPVRAMAISQISSTRAVLETLMAAYSFEAVLSDKLYFRTRGGAPAVTIPYEDLGAGTSQGGEAEPLALQLVNDVEMPAQIAVSYQNVDADYNIDTQMSDRLLGVQGSTSTVQLPLGLTAAEAKQIADTMVGDQMASTVNTKLHLLGKYTRLEPTDVVTAMGKDGSAYRLRLVRRNDASGVLAFDAVLDDASVLTATGITSSDYVSTTVVAAVADTELELMDIPILRDVDNDPGLYAAVGKNAGSAWPGAALFESLDDVSYGELLTLASSAVIGTATTALGTWTGGVVFDEANSVTVTVNDQLTSVTRDALLTSTSNAMLVGDEIIQFRSASLVSTNVYKLTGLLRGRLGTEWAVASHVIGERAVLLRNTGLLRIARQAGELGVPYYYKAVTFGRQLSTATAESITPSGNGLKPYAPVDLRGSRSSSGDAVITWKRRTRLQARFTGPAGINVPLGEASESYAVEIYSSNTYSTLKRTINAATATATYTASQQEADFGTVQDVLYVKVYQVSAVVGRGRALTGVITLSGDTFSPLASANPDVRVASGNDFIITRGGATKLGFYRYTDGDATSSLVGTVAANEANYYLPRYHLAATDGAGGYVLFLRGYTNPESARKMVQGDVDGSPAIVTPSFMPADPPFALCYAGGKYIAITVGGTVFHSTDRLNWTNEGSITWGGTLPTAGSFTSAKIVEVDGTLAMLFGGALYYDTAGDGLTWSAATVAAPSGTYADWLHGLDIATDGTRAVVVRLGKKSGDSNAYGLVYDTPDGQTWTKRFEDAVDALATALPPDTTVPGIVYSLIRFDGAWFTNLPALVSGVSNVRPFLTLPDSSVVNTDRFALDAVAGTDVVLRRGPTLSSSTEDTQAVHRSEDADAWEVVPWPAT